MTSRCSVGLASFPTSGQTDSRGSSACSREQAGCEPGPGLHERGAVAGLVCVGQARLLRCPVHKSGRATWARCGHKQTASILLGVSVPETLGVANDSLSVDRVMRHPATRVLAEQSHRRQDLHRRHSAPCRATPWRSTCLRDGPLSRVHHLTDCNAGHGRGPVPAGGNLPTVRWGWNLRFNLLTIQPRSPRN